MKVRFVQVDVFTEHVFGGNALAVFVDGRDVPEGLMQPLAREMNLSETTFVLPPDSAANLAKVRIFTPGAELPMAGHPTIGTAYVLAAQGMTSDRAFTLEEKVGPIPVRIDGEPSNPGVIWMTQPLPTFGPEMINREEIAARLSIGREDLLDVPVRTGSAGLPFVFVGMRTQEGVDRVALGDRDLSALSGDGGQGIFVYSPAAEHGRNEVYSRMLGSHGLGIVEDPATGGASGPLGALLVREGVVPAGELVEIVSRQGVAMGRQSDIHIRLAYESGTLSQVEVGGTAVPVLEGTVTL